MATTKEFFARTMTTITTDSGLIDTEVSHVPMENRGSIKEGAIDFMAGSLGICLAAWFSIEIGIYIFPFTHESTYAKIVLSIY